MECDGTPILVEKRGHLGLITLNRPTAINALTREMVAILEATLRSWAPDPEVETIALTGSGERGLCAGGDIVAIYRDAVEGGTRSEDFWRDEYRLNALIASYPKPYVALMDGLVLGGGLGVSAHASHRVVTERTRMGMPETAIGFVPDVGGTWLLAHAPGELGTYVALTACHVGAGDAIAMRLADHYVPADQLETLVSLLVDMPAAEALAKIEQVAPEAQLAAQSGWIDDVFGHDSVEQIIAALSTSPEPAAASALAAMLAKSPTSEVVTLRALRAASQMASLEEALAQELRIAIRMLRDHDLREGIRAQLIDKDRNPNWQPTTLADVDPTSIDAYFQPLEHELVL